MTVDANVIIAYLGGDENVIDILSSWRQQGGLLYLSTVVETEVLSFSQLTPQQSNDMQIFLEENFVSIAFDRQLSRLAAQLRRTVKIKFPDAAIAATALYTNTPLVTRNQKDFKKINGLQLVSI